MSDPKFIQSALSCAIREDGTEVRIDICRLETTDWSLEVVDETGQSTVPRHDHARKAVAHDGEHGSLRVAQVPPVPASVVVFLRVCRGVQLHVGDFRFKLIFQGAVLVIAGHLFQGQKSPPVFELRPQMGGRTSSTSQERRAGA
jgi:hypothetical protein